MKMLKSGSKSISLKNVHIQDDFWSKYAGLVREVVIPYQYEALHDRVPGVDPSYAIHNFRIAAGREEGEFGGKVFQDSDLAKWLEAVAYSLTTHPDARLENKVDAIVDLIEEAQQPDGYLNTYFIIKEPDKRWTNLTDCHELYCAGHLMEAAVAYYEATGKRKLLDVLCRYADYIDTVFGPEPGKINGYDGHQEIELALVKLYRVTGEEKYLQLSRYFIDQRGQAPSFFEQEFEKRGRTHFNAAKRNEPLDLKYNQSHLPVRVQTEAVGHAVRAVYMYTAMADLAAYTKDESLVQACKRLWSNMTNKQLYITGGIGSTHHGEAFTFDYDLPNDTVYAETCASIGLVFFANRMLRLEAKSEYADVLERALFNTVISGMAQDGKHFFYVNPLEVWPEASRNNPGRRHVKPVRPGWFACACCPPNAARLIASLGEYVYTSSEDTLFTHLYIGGEAAVRIGAANVKVEQESSLPWEGSVRMRITPEQAAAFTVALRIPDWCDKAALRVNGEAVDLSSVTKDGYAYVRQTWQQNDTIELDLPMDIKRVRSHPQVRSNAGKVAIQRGPLVYCLESVENGSPLTSIILKKDGQLSAKYDPGFLGGAVIIEGEAVREDEAAWGQSLYSAGPKKQKAVTMTAIPYYLWGNRGEVDMTVWVRE